mgnify:CR=1 FL=1
MTGKAGTHAARAALADEESHVESFRQTRHNRRTELVEDYVELIADLIDEKGEARGTDVALRLGVPVADRHSALGDALVTAEVFLRLLPLLAGMGLSTLGQVRAASQQTQRARHQP